MRRNAATKVSEKAPQMFPAENKPEQLYDIISYRKQLQT